MPDDINDDICDGATDGTCTKGKNQVHDDRWCDNIREIDESGDKVIVMKERAETYIWLGLNRAEGGLWRGRAPMMRVREVRRSKWGMQIRILDS